MSKKTVYPYFAAADRETVRPILEALEKTGVRLGAPAEAKKGGVVLLFLSKAFAADEELQRRFLDADSAGSRVIPVDLDGAEQSELVRSALMARNAIAAQGRTPDEIAARALSAEAFARKKPLLPRILIAAALLLALGAGLWIWRSRAGAPAGPQDAVPAMTESSLAAARRLGLTPEDLATIDSFCIVGDAQGTSRSHFTTNSTVNPGLRTYLDDLAYDSEDDRGRHWYSTKDGHEYTLTRYDDLSVIELMPNLRSLTLVLVEADKLPSLKGLDRLEELRLENCRLGSLEWARDASMIYLTCRDCDIEDFSVLGSMKSLRDASIELGEVQRADFSGAGAPALHKLFLRGGGQLREADLSGLGGCALWELYLNDLPVRDLAFLSGQNELQLLELCNLPQLRGLESLRGSASLTEVRLRDLPDVNDLTPLGTCGKLRSFSMENMRQIRDLDFLTGCGALNAVMLENADIEDLDFVGTMSHGFRYGLTVNGRVGDWSGLAQGGYYGELCIRPENGSVAAILPWLEGAKVESLEISNARDLDLAALPEVTGRLSLHDCANLEDLSALGEQHLFSSLELWDLPRLRSLEGLQKNRYFCDGTGNFLCSLSVEDCPRLEDWSALEGSSFSEIRLKKIYTLPDLGAVSFGKRALLRLESIPDLEDLSCLDAIAAPEKIYFSFELVDLPGLRDLSALRRFRGEHLAVMPELQDQAQALAESKNFDRVDVAYPAGGWNDSGYDDFTLLSLEELDTLSDRALSRVTSLCLAGDRLVDREIYDVWTEWNGAAQSTVLIDRASGERTTVKMGSYTDLTAFAKLTGLRQLTLSALPLESLDGVQYMDGLEELWMQNCPKLTDASAAFTLQHLRRLSLGNTKIDSIRGVQNCTELCGLEIYGTKVADLSPLREIDYGFSERNGGFELRLGGTNCGDYSPIEAIPVLRCLEINSVDYARWPDLTKTRELRSLSAHGVNGFGQEALEALLAAHPELEELEIPYDRDVTDLTPLLGMENLRFVKISKDMSKAAASLDGQRFDFELQIVD